MPVWLRRLRARLKYRSFDADLRQELETHRAMAQRDLEAGGLPPSVARAAASRTLGNVTLAREDARAVWFAPWLESIWQDIRYGFRSLRRSPVFTITALLTMAIGIGLTTAMFAAFNAIALRGWPVENADSLVLVRLEPSQQRTARSRSGFSLDELADFQQRSRTLSVVAAKYRGFEYIAASPTGRPETVYGQYVTPGFFDATGVRMELGRNFRPEEDANGAGAEVAIISYPLWQRMFSGSADVIGQSLYIGKVPFTIVGVTREGWRGEQPYRDDLWLPLQTVRQLHKDYILFADGSNACCVNVVGRLAPGISHAQAAEELTLLRLQREHESSESGRRVHVSDTSFYDQSTGAWRLAVPALVLIATGLVLLLTGANIAHLQLARAIARTREIRTRLALGAGRLRVARQLVTESLLLSAVAGAAALALVYALLDSMMLVAEMPAREIWQPNLTVFAYCAAVSVLMSVTFSLLPALKSTRVSLAHGAGLGATPSGRMRFNLVLLTTQIALSTSLLTGASLLSRAIVHATSGDFGFAIKGLTMAVYSPSGSAEERRTMAEARRKSLDLALGSSSLPRTAFMNTLPLTFYETVRVRRPEDGPAAMNAIDFFPMSSSAFEVLGVQIVEGRAYSDREATEAVVNQRAARLLWPGRSAVGQTLLVVQKAYRIVGISKDAHFSSRENIRPTLHVAMEPNALSPVILVRAEGPAVSDQLKGIIRGVDPGAAVVARPLTEQYARDLRDAQAGARAAWAGSALALALATFGVFGVFAHVVELRRREIGIRVALGGGGREILGSLFRTTRFAVLGGLFAGLLLSVGTGPILQDLLYGLSPFDPVAFVTVAVILGIAGVVATFIPARRALKVDPATTLRAE